MKTDSIRATRFTFAVLLCAGLLTLLSINTLAQRKSQSSKVRKTTTTSVPKSAYERGYDAGYVDGYNTGKHDYTAELDRDYQRSEQYQKAERGYNAKFGDQTEYQDGYRMAFEIAYTDGYYGRPMSAKMPPNLAAQRNQNPAIDAAKPAPSTTETAPRSRTTSGSLIPDNTEVKVRLSEPINTKVNREGDRFKATVISPTTYEGAIVEGFISKLTRSGKLTGKTELAIAFDRITLPDGRNGQFLGQVERIYATESVKTVDEEGNVETSSKTRDTQIRTAGGAALGAIIGAIAGGGKGAAIGAIVGAGAGAGSVYVQGNKDILLDVGTEIQVRTTVRQGEKNR